MTVIDIIDKVLYIGIFVLSAISTVVAFLNKKTTKRLSLHADAKASESESGLIDIISNIIPKAIQNAEEWLGAGKGHAKKEFVLDKIESTCYKLGIPFDEEFFSGVIEKDITMTKNVNAALDHKVQAPSPESNIYPRIK